MVISQKPLNFGMKRHCKIQDKMVCNGLGNRCSIQKVLEHRSRELISNPTSAGACKNPHLKGAPAPNRRPSSLLGFTKVTSRFLGFQYFLE